MGISRAWSAQAPQQYDRVSVEQAAPRPRCMQRCCALQFTRYNLQTLTSVAVHGALSLLPLGELLP